MAACPNLKDLLSKRSFLIFKTARKLDRNRDYRQRLASQQIFNFHHGVVRIFKINTNACGLNNRRGMRLTDAHLAWCKVFELIAVFRKTGDASNFFRKAFY